MVTIPIEWVPLVFIITIVCYICQFIGAMAQRELADEESKTLQRELRSELVDNQIHRYLSQMGYDGGFSLDRSQRSSGSGFKVCDNCGGSFTPIANESGICKCPHCGKGYIL